MNRKRRQNSEGFTLVELLLALTLAGLLSLSLYTSLFTGYRSQQKTEQALKPLREGQLALEVIVADLSGALPPKGVLAGPFIGLQQQSSISGQLSSFLSFFLRPAADLETAPGIVKVEYLLSEEPEPKLLRRLTVNLLSPEEPEPIEELLCQPVSSFTLRYFDGSQWLETWDSTTRGDCLPVAVEITIERPVTQDSAENKEHRIFRRVVNLPCWSAPSDISVAESQFS